MRRQLSFDLNPPAAAVLPFFFSAPLFALLAGLLLLWLGPAAMASRWSPATLGLAHLFTLGVLSMSMIGALIQLLPAVAGCPVPHAATLGRSVHALLCCGTVLLVAGFVFSLRWAMQLAPALLLGAFGWLLAGASCALWRQQAAGTAPMVGAIRLALAALLVTIGLGAALASAFAWPGLTRLPLPLLTDLHAGWGLLGWTGLLVAGVAFQVLPMFQVTPLYAAAIERWLATCLFLALVLWSVSIIAEVGQALAAAALAAGFALFAGVTWRLLARRKPAADAMTLSWRLAMASLVAACLLASAPAALGGQARGMALGVLFVFGFAGSVILGMLYKIVPFLLWYHLQGEPGVTRASMPSVKQLVPERGARQQVGAHALALALLVCAAWWPELLARPAALAVCVASAWLARNLFGALRIARRAVPRSARPCAA
ncbi:MAG: permease [Pseudomonadota bacterium]